MDFLWSGMVGRAKFAQSTMEYTAAPNPLYVPLWRQIHTSKAEDERNTTKSNAEHMGNILETFAARVFVDRGRSGITTLLNFLIHVDGRKEMQERKFL